MELEDFQAVTDLVAENLRVQTQAGKFSEARRGRCGKKFIIIPTWILSTCEEYQIYYAVHEAVHLRYKGHAPPFHSTESHLLKELLDLEIEYRRAYPRSLSVNGQQVYERKGKKKEEKKGMDEIKEKVINRIEELDQETIKLYQKDWYWADHHLDEVGKYHTYYLPICYRSEELGITDDEAYHLRNHGFSPRNLRFYGQGFTLYFDRDKLGLRKKEVRVKAKQRPAPKGEMR